MLWCQALADQVCVIVSMDWRSPATILPVFYRQMLPKTWVLSQQGVSKVKCYTYHGNHVFYVILTIIPLLFLLFHPIQAWGDVPMLWWSFLYIYPHIFPLLSIQSKTNGSTNSGSSHQCCLPRRHYCMLLLLMHLGFDAPSSDCLAKWLTHLLVKPPEWVTGVLQSIETIM